METPRLPVLVLGVGNILWADEGFGVRCVEELHARYTFPDGVELLDGGTQGLYLVPDVARAARLLLLDAVDFGDEPGTVRLLRNEDVPRFTGAKKMSMHQTGMQDVLSAVQLLDRLPDEVVLLGAQPRDLADFGGGLTPELAACVEQALPRAVEVLTAWGYPPRPRAREARGLVASGVERRSYEEGRPSAEDACRVGDARFFPRGEV